MPSAGGRKGSFAAQLKGFAERVETNAVDVRRGVALKLFGAIIKDTPVDKGRLRASWHTTVGAPGSLGPEGRTNHAQATREVAESAAKLEGDDSIHMTNNMPYALRIENEGWSHTKAPDGMMWRNVIRFERLLSEAVAKARRGGGGR